MQLEAKGVSFRYSKKTPWILKDVDLTVKAGERLGLVGPSGYGKSTFARLLSGYLSPAEGEICWNGAHLPRRGYCPVQLISQHPDLAVNPRWKMARILNECWRPDEALLEKLGILSAWLDRWPIELSGGELQRFCVARSLGPDTGFLICDEITTMLDAITQAQVWNHLLEHTEKRKMGILIITHHTDLAEKICHRIVEMPAINKI